MPGLVRKSLDSPEETRPFEGGKGQLELVNMEGASWDAPHSFPAGAGPCT